MRLVAVFVLGACVHPAGGIYDVDYQYADVPEEIPREEPPPVREAKPLRMPMQLLDEIVKNADELP